MPGPELLLGLADIVILALVLLLILHMAYQQFRIPLKASPGRTVLLAGVFLAAFSQFAQRFTDDRLVPVPVPLAAGAAAAGLPEWLFWVASRAAILLILVGLYAAFRQTVQLERRALATSHAAREAESQALKSEERFRSLFETQTNPVYCYTFDPPMPVSLPVEEQVRHSLDAVLTDCNDAFARELDCDKASDVIGTRKSLLDSTKDAPSHSRYISDFAASGYRLSDYELIYKSPNGEDRAISINATGIIRDGCLVRMWGVERSILAARRTESALHRRREYQATLAAISSRLVTTQYDDADQVMVDCLKRICKYIGGNRITLSWIDLESRTGEVLYTWHEGDQSMIYSIDQTRFPYLSEKLLHNEPLCISTLDNLPPEADVDRQILRSVGMQSFLFRPLAIAGEIVGLLTMGNDAQICEWADQDLEDLQVFGELLANFVMRMRQRQALDAALDGLHRATERLEAENIYLRTEIKLNHDFEEIVGESDALRRSLQMVEQVADTMTPVLILGETGTGKELIARALHEHSSRRHRPLVKVNCAALPANLIESELFGYEKGAFTSADAAKRGRFDLAHGSTLFLDEIGEIPFELQAKLLRVLQEGEFERLGGSKTVKVDVRIIAATNRDLWQACEDGEFRSDLYYRINTFPIELPALRDRGDDIRLLAEHFARLHAQRLGRELTAISARMMKQLEQYDWPGNVRELEGVIQRALLSSSGPILELGHPLAGRSPGERGDDTAAFKLRQVERDHIATILDECSWKISGDKGAAAALGIPPSTLRSKMKKLGIKRPN